MAQDRFKIVFEKVPPEADKHRELAAESAIIQAELEEIAELRRLVDEISQPVPKTYTAT